MFKTMFISHIFEHPARCQHNPKHNATILAEMSINIITQSGENVDFFTKPYDNINIIIQSYDQSRFEENAIM
jgi:hypothetical protein